MLKENIVKNFEPDSFPWDSFDLKTLKSNLNQWIKKYGNETVLTNNTYYNVSYKMITKKEKKHGK